MSVWQPEAIVARMPLNATWRAWLRAASPHAWQLAIIAGAYFAYMYTRALVFDDVKATALANAAKIISLEKSLGFFWEPSWQAWAIDGVKALVVFFNWTYIITFWPIIATAGVILYVKDRPQVYLLPQHSPFEFRPGPFGLHAVPPGPAPHDDRTLLC